MNVLTIKSIKNQMKTSEMFEPLCLYEVIETNRPEGSLLNNNHTVCSTGQSVSLSVSHNFPSHHVHRRHVEKLCKLSGLNCTALHSLKTRISQSNLTEGCSCFYTQILKLI